MRLFKMTPRKKKILQKVIILLLVGFFALTAFVVMAGVTFVDLEITEEIQEHNNIFFDVAMEFVSWFGKFPQSLIMALVVAAAFRIANYKKEALYTLFTLGSGIVSAGLKLLFNRDRPTEDVVRVLVEADNKSFPSGHALFYVVFFGFIILTMMNRKDIPNWLRLSTILFSISMILLVPVSRVYLGAHWFTDVLGGFMLGVVCLYVLGYFYYKSEVR